MRHAARVACGASCFGIELATWSALPTIRRLSWTKHRVLECAVPECLQGAGPVHVFGWRTLCKQQQRPNRRHLVLQPRAGAADPRALRPHRRCDVTSTLVGRRRSYSWLLYPNHSMCFTKTSRCNVVAGVVNWRYTLRNNPTVDCMIVCLCVFCCIRAIMP